MQATAADPYEKARDLAKKLDEKLSDKRGYSGEWLHDSLHWLIETGRVEVGYRSSCGTTDFTMTIYEQWVKVLKALRKSGVVIAEESVKHKNAWATKSGGFWNSTIYTIAKAEGR